MKSFLLACALIVFSPSLALASMVSLGETPLIESFLATDSIRHIDENRILVVTLQNVKPGLEIPDAPGVKSMLVQVQLNCSQVGMQAIGHIVGFSEVNAKGLILTEEPSADRGFRISNGTIGLKLWRMVCGL